MVQVKKFTVQKAEEQVVRLNVKTGTDNAPSNQEGLDRD